MVVEKNTCEGELIMGTVKNQTLSGVKWSAIEKISIQGITFALGIIVARLLTPADYGLIGMVSIFFAVSQTLIDSGFGNALVRKLDSSDDDFYTAFYFSFAVSIVCACLLCLGSPWIADFFKQPLLAPITRLSSLNLVIVTLGMISNTKLTIALDFKTGAKINFASSVVSGVLGLILAFLGYGVWSLVWQNLIANVMRTILALCYYPMKIRFLFNYQSFKQLFGYGSKLSLSGLLHTLYSELTTILIGKFYSPASLGNYSRGTSLVTMPLGIITGIVSKVSFPILSKIQDDDERLIKVYRGYISLIMMGVVYGCFLIASLAKPLILGLLSEKWESAIIFAQIFVFAVVFDPICSLNLNLLQVKGRSDLFLRLEIIKKVIALVILLGALPFGAVAICLSKVLYTQIAVIINTYYTGKLFGLGYWKQWKDFSPYILYATIACIPSLVLAYISSWYILNLVIGGTISTLLYIVILWMMRDSIFMEHVIPVLKDVLGKYRNLIVIKN